MFRFTYAKAATLGLMLLPVSGTALAGESFHEAFSQEVVVDQEVLQQSRGKNAVFDLESTGTASLSGNSVQITGLQASNTISGPSFSHASGAFNIVQNAGNNVIIQQVTTFAVNFSN